MVLHKNEDESGCVILERGEGRLWRPTDVSKIHAPSYNSNNAGTTTVVPPTTNALSSTLMKQQLLSYLHPNMLRQLAVFVRNTEIFTP